MTSKDLDIFKIKKRNLHLENCSKIFGTPKHKRTKATEKKQNKFY